MTVNTPARQSTPFLVQLFWYAVGTLVLLVFAGMAYQMWPNIKAQYYGTEPAQVQQPAPALIVPTPVRLPAPVYVQAPAPVLVQSVPAGEVPQPVQLQPQPAPVQAENAPAAEPAPAPIIIVHQVSADNSRQTITGSGACKVAKVAARCSK